MLPTDRRYSKEHEWIRPESGEGVVGLTQFAVDELGDIVYVELPAVGSTLAQFAAFGVVESVKAVSDLFAPASGEVHRRERGAAHQPRAHEQRPA